MRTIAILGPGGVGGFLAAALARSGESVKVVARESTAEQITRQGIAVESVRLGRFTAQPEAAPSLDEPAEVLIVATKATTLEPALDRVQAEPGLVVPLLNGLDHITLLRGRFGADHVAAAAIRIESTALEPGRIAQTSPFLRVDLAADDPQVAERLEPLRETLERAEVPARIVDTEAHALWWKLVRLVALACTTSASDRTIGFIRSDPGWRRTLIGCIEEAAAVANAHGGDVDPSASLAELDEAHPELGSSMQRDIAARREPELDAIAGAVLRAGKRAGIECPTLARLSLCIAERAGVSPPRG